MEFHIPSTASVVRFDFGTEPGEFEIRSVYLQYADTVSQIAPEDFENPLAEQQMNVQIENGQIAIETTGTDPFLAVTVDSSEVEQALEKEAAQTQMVKNVVVLAILDIGFLLLFLLRKKLLVLPKELLQNRRLILKLAVNDFKTKYAGSYLGIVWAFVQPIVTILVYWFVFSVGLKSGKCGSVSIRSLPDNRNHFLVLFPGRIKRRNKRAFGV